MIAGISTTSEAMRAFVSQAQNKKALLIGGEPGTGKKYVAKNIIHKCYGSKENYLQHIIILEDLLETVDQTKIYIVEDPGIFNNMRRLIADAIWLDPLRERIEDIPIFVEYFSAKYSLQTRWNERENLNRLLSYWWPYNVHELKRVVLSGDNSSLLPFDKLDTILSHYSATEVLSIKINEFWQELGDNINPGKFFQLFLDTVEKEFIKSALKHCDGSRKETAELLNIHRNTLIHKMRKFGIGKRC